ncbi:hypothetical protein GJ496_005722 [Pomphorhynchus laevis]|nr:hypothetical protein GJ496_005722 [Pomphorhynchus laevis]
MYNLKQKLGYTLKFPSQFSVCFLRLTLNLQNSDTLTATSRLSYMGGSISAPGLAPEWGTEGFHVLQTQQHSPAYYAGIQSYFDFIVAINGHRLDKDDNTLRAVLKEQVNNPIQLCIYSTKHKKLRNVEVTPKDDWGGPGYLGISIRFCSFAQANETVWHVTEVLPGSPAQAAGLISNYDYIIGSDVVLSSKDDLLTLIEVNDHQPIKLYCYNCKTDSTREVILTPDSSWPGEGSIGCQICCGYLHQIPSPSNIDSAHVVHEKCSHSEYKESIVDNQCGLKFEAVFGTSTTNDVSSNEDRTNQFDVVAAAYSSNTDFENQQKYHSDSNAEQIMVSTSSAVFPFSTEVSNPGQTIAVSVNSNLVNSSQYASNQTISPFSYLSTLNNRATPSLSNQITHSLPLVAKNNTAQIPDPTLTSPLQPPVYPSQSVFSKIDLLPSPMKLQHPTSTTDYTIKNNDNLISSPSHLAYATQSTYDVGHHQNISSTMPSVLNYFIPDSNSAPNSATQNSSFQSIQPPLQTQPFAKQQAAQSFNTGEQSTDNISLSFPYQSDAIAQQQAQSFPMNQIPCSNTYQSVDHGLVSSPLQSLQGQQQQQFSQQSFPNSNDLSWMSASYPYSSPQMHHPPS